MAKRRQEEAALEIQCNSVKRFRALDDTVASRTRCNLKNVENRFITPSTLDALEHNLERGGLYASPQGGILNLAGDPVDVVFQYDWVLESLPKLLELLLKSRVTRSISVFIGYHTQVTEALMRVLGSNEGITTLTIYMTRADSLNISKIMENIYAACDSIQNAGHFLTKLILKFSYDDDDNLSTECMPRFCKVLQAHPQITHLELYDCMGFEFCTSLIDVRSLKSLKFVAPGWIDDCTKNEHYLRLALKHPSLEELVMSLGCKAEDICEVLKDCLPCNECLRWLLLEVYTYKLHCQAILGETVDMALKSNTALRRFEIVERFIIPHHGRTLRTWRVVVSEKAALAKLNNKHKWQGIKTLMR